MKVPYSVDIASHAVPESCVSYREVRREALAGVRAGQPSSRESLNLFQGADAVSVAEGNTRWGVIASPIEGYPDLVVHGPLTAHKLFAFTQSRLPRPIRQFSFRAVAPLFVEQPATLVIASEPNRVECLRCDGEIAMSATVSMETTGDPG